MSEVEEATVEGRPFLDTNVLLYLVASDVTKAEVAEGLLEAGGTISVQVLNEFASAATRKLTTDTHDLGLAYMDRFGYSVYDCMILAAATLANCSLVLTEDMQSGQKVTGTLAIRNPFES